MAFAISQDQLAELCRRYGVKRLALYGSVLRGEDKPESDVDILVEFLPESKIGFFGLVALQNELSQLIGRRVDLRTLEELSRYFRKQVLDSARTLYVS